MKKLMMAATAIAALTVATPALADGDNTSTDTEVFNITGVNPAKCNLESNNYNVLLPNNVISDNEGFARTDISAAVANGLNALDITAWCTGNTNKVNAYRTALSTGSGERTTDGFNQAVIYDVNMTIAGAVRSDGFGSTEGTADGQGNGVGLGIGAGLTLSRFGPSGAGAVVSFDPEQPSVAVTSTAPGAGARSAFTTDSNRLVAGTYTSTLTIEVTPGV